MHFLIQHASEITVGPRYVRDTSLPVMANLDLGAFIPAVAIPLERKQDFECPPTHRRHLEQLLPRVSKLLLIGWRATDEPFLELLRTHMLGRPKAYVVAKDGREAATIVQRVENYGLNLGSHTVAKRGFGDFVVGREGEKFLSE